MRAAGLSSPPRSVAPSERARPRAFVWRECVASVGRFGVASLPRPSRLWRNWGRRAGAAATAAGDRRPRVLARRCAGSERRIVVVRAQIPAASDLDDVRRTNRPLCERAERITTVVP